VILPSDKPLKKAGGLVSCAASWRTTAR